MMLAAPGSSVTGMKGRAEAPEADGVTADDGVTASSEDGAWSRTNTENVPLSKTELWSNQKSFRASTENYLHEMKRKRSGLVFLTSPFLSCQGLGLTRSSASARTGGHSSSLMQEDEEESSGGMGELEGHSAGRIMLAGIRAPTTASLRATTPHIPSVKLLRP